MADEPGTQGTSRQCRIVLRGVYRPLPITGTLQDKAFAFLRNSDTCQAITVVPRLTAHLAAGNGTAAEIWKDTQVILPVEVGQTQWYDVFTGQVFHPSKTDAGTILRLGELFADFPVTLLTSQLRMYA